MKRLLLSLTVIALLAGVGSAFVSGQSAGGAFVPTYDYPGIYNRVRTVVCAFSTTCANTDTGMTGRVFGGIVQLTAGTATVSGVSPAFTSTSSGFCIANDTTVASGALAKAVIASTTSITISGTGTDAIAYQCVVF